MRCPTLRPPGKRRSRRQAGYIPDLVLMDIFLNGEMDGIQAAGQIRSRHNIPIIYLTAYADSNTLQRAKITEPFGYILKPFEERELLTTIEMALYKYRIEQRLKDSERWLRHHAEEHRRRRGRHRQGRPHQVHEPGGRDAHRLEGERRAGEEPDRGVPAGQRVTRGRCSKTRWQECSARGQ